MSPSRRLQRSSVQRRPCHALCRAHRSDPCSSYPRAAHHGRLRSEQVGSAVRHHCPGSESRTTVAASSGAVWSTGDPCPPPANARRARPVARWRSRAGIRWRGHRSLTCSSPSQWSRHPKGSRTAAQGWQCRATARIGDQAVAADLVAREAERAHQQYIQVARCELPGAGAAAWAGQLQYPDGMRPQRGPELGPHRPWQQGCYCSR